LWLVFITVESVLGTLRVLFLEPRVGAEPAQWTGFVTGSAALLIVAYLLIEWIRIPRWVALLEIGMLWVALTLFFRNGDRIHPGGGVRNVCWPDMTSRIAG
jgi:hypothetical protein